MKRILIFSDSHGDTSNMVQITINRKPDMIIHLGDCLQDARYLQSAFPEIPVEYVPGNCDFSSDPGVRVLLIDGHKIMICHGHQYSVKSSYTRIAYAAMEKNAEVVLFGHTHILFQDHHNGLMMLNPGSISKPMYHSPKTYGMMMIDGSKITLNTYKADDFL